MWVLNYAVVLLHMPYAIFECSSLIILFYVHAILVEVMYCQPPKSKFTLAMEQLELKFRIESKPVVFLIVILITNAALYVALIPFLVSSRVYRAGYCVSL